MRQEEPMVSCAATNRTIPATASSAPTVNPAALSNGGHGSKPLAAAIGATTRSTIASTNNPAPSRSTGGAPRRGSTSPVEPVRSHWNQVRTPNASTANTTSSTIAVVLLIPCLYQRDAGAPEQTPAGAVRGRRPLVKRYTFTPDR